MDAGQMLVRTVNVAKLDIPTIEAVEADESLTQEAGTVVAIVSVIGALGSLFSGDIWFFIASIIISLIGWFVWSFISSFIAQKIFSKDTVDTGEMLRTIGYAYAPFALGIFSFIPILGAILGLIGFIWALVAIVTGMRQAAEMTTVQAIITAVVGFIPFAIVMGIVGSILT